MKLMGRVWNSLPQHERLTLLHKSARSHPEIGYVSLDNILDGLTACIVCDEPDSNGYRAETRYWLEQLVLYLRDSSHRPKEK